MLEIKHENLITGASSVVLLSTRLNLSYWEQWALAFKNVFIGYAPEINTEHCLSGSIQDQIPKITKAVEEIITSNSGKRFKFGKSGDPALRADFADYRSAPYSEMHLLFQSDKESVIENLEEYYATMYAGRARCDNKDTLSLGKMKSCDGLYYLYLVI